MKFNSRFKIYYFLICLGTFNSIFLGLGHCEAPFMADELIVQMAPGVSSAVKGKTFATCKEYRELRNVPSFFRAILPTGSDVINEVSKMKGRNGVKWAQPNYKYTLYGCTSPTDAYFTGNNKWAYDKINANLAWLTPPWPSCPPGSPNVIVAVVDTGITRNHPDLPTSSTLFVPGYNAVNNTYDTVVPTATNDDIGHGTFISGIIWSQWNNFVTETCSPFISTTGFAGLAPGVKLMPVKIADSSNPIISSANAANGIAFAAQFNADVICLAFGHQPPSAGDDNLVGFAIDYALSLNCVVVVSSGDEGTNIVSFPASYPPVISVGATGPNDEHPSYSNTGTKLDIVAPGGLRDLPTTPTPVFNPATKIYSTRMVCPTPGFPLTTFDPSDNNFGTGVGTSFSAPFVAGAAALIRSLYPDLPQAEVKSRILSNTDFINGQVGYTTFTGWGRLNVFKAVMNINTPIPTPTPIPIPTPVPTFTNCQ